MGESPQMGLKFDFGDYRAKMDDAVKSLTVKDLVSVLRGRIKRLFAASNPGDVVFVTQNLTVLGALVARDGQPMGLTSIQSILDRLVQDDLGNRKKIGTLPTNKRLDFAIPFRGPRFHLEPDLNDKPIRTAITVHGRQEATITPYEQFFEDIVRLSGDTSLYNVAVSSSH